MCGIVGYVAPGSVPELESTVSRMLLVQAHRGPDDEGSWSGVVGQTSVAIGASRLAILDLSPAGHQPMVSPDGRYVLAFNGEVYNYVELREELKSLGCEFRSTSDTEVVLQALCTWGPAALARFNGMWGLAFLDQDTRSLLLARDRFGKKPLYLYENRGSLYFASEIKAILEGSQERFAINPVVAGRYLRQFLLDADNQTFFAGIEKLPAGHYVEANLGREGSKLDEPQPFWKVEEQDFSGARTADLIETVHDVFLDAVKLRLRSDVPVGILLSGGLDSSSISAAAHQINGPDRCLHLFSAVSDNPKYSEESHIDVMARHLGQPVEKVWLDRYTPERIIDLFGEATWFNDEPLGAFSCMAQFLLMQRAKECGVTVILSGQGADELLCGYRKYIPLYLQHLLTTRQIGAATRFATGFIQNGSIRGQFDLPNAKRYLPRWLRAQEIDVRGAATKSLNTDLPLGLASRGLLERQKADLTTYSIPAIVHWEDRMSMAWSREVRDPFLDYRLVNLFLSLPLELKLRSGWTKWIMRKAMAPMLPQAIAWRKDKQGFTTPEPHWLKHELHQQVRTMLGEEMLTARAGIMNQANVQRRYAAYQTGSRRYGMVSWNDALYPVALEIWARRFERYLRW